MELESILYHDHGPRFVYNIHVWGIYNWDFVPIIDRAGDIIDGFFHYQGAKSKKHR